MTPFLTDVKSEIKGGTFISSMIDKMTGQVPAAPPVVNIPNKSMGSIKTSQANGPGSAAHGVKSKSLFNKTKSNAGNARHKTIAGPSKPTPGALGINATSLTSSLEADLSNFNFSGSIDPLVSLLSGKSGSISSDIIKDLETPLETILNKELFDPVYTLLTAHIDIPFVSALYYFLTGHKLTVSNLFSLISAVPAVLIYEIATDGKFIDDSLKNITGFKVPVSSGGQSQTLTQTESPTKGENLLDRLHLGKLEDDVKHFFGEKTPPAEASYAYTVEMAILYCAFTETGIILNGAIDYLNYSIMKQQGNYSAPGIVDLLHVGNALFGIGAAASYWAVNKNIGISLKIDMDNQANPGKITTEYINGWNTVNDALLGFTIVASIGKAVWSIGEFEFPELASGMDKVTKGMYAVLGLLTFGGVVALYAGRVASLGDSSSFQKALQERMELNLTGTLCMGISMILSIPKSAAKKSGNRYAYIAVCGIDLIASEAAVGCKTAGEITFAKSQLPS